MGSLSHVDVEI